MKANRNVIHGALVSIPRKGSMNDQTRVVFKRGELANMRAKAIRRGVWFKVLSKAERAYIELTMRIVDAVRSHLLARVLTSITRKLLDAMRGRVLRGMEEIGRPFARKLSQIAQNWGNMSAIKWAKHYGFIQYLTVIYMNTPTMFK
jgi:hypothetical protein